MSVAFLQLVSQPKDSFDPHLSGKIPVKRTGCPTLITKDSIPCVYEIEFGGKYVVSLCTRRSASSDTPVAYVQVHSSCSQTHPCPPLSTG